MSADAVDLTDVTISVNDRSESPHVESSARDDPTLTEGASKTTAILTSLTGASEPVNALDAGATGPSPSRRPEGGSSDAPSTAPSSTGSPKPRQPTDEAMRERDERYRAFMQQQMARRKRRIIAIAACAICLLLMGVIGLVVTAAFGWLCAASLWDGTDEWACGGSGVASAVLMLFFGMGPILAWALVFIYNSSYFLCCRKLKCCGDYREFNW